MPGIVNNKLFLSYKGEVTYDNIGALLSELKIKMEEQGFRLGTYKKVLAVMVECLENIYKYISNTKDKDTMNDKYPSYFSLEAFEGYFILKAGNPLLNEDRGKLEEKLVKVNALNEIELKDMYKAIITDGKFTEKGGAGLGFIEMIKTTGNKIEFTFDEIDNRFSFFNITLNIPVKKL